MNFLSEFWAGLDWSVLTDMLFAVIPSLLCITLHELAHGYVAWRLGDSTAKNAGRLSLNPLRHIDPLGLVMMVAFRFGWAKPVPVNMWNFRKVSPKTGMAITAAAGPLCNLVLCVLMLAIYGLVYLPLTRAGTSLADAVLQTVSTTAYLSLALAVFNVLPIPPLDGSKVLFSLMDDAAYEKLMRYERFGMLLLLVVVSTGLLSGPLSTATQWLYDKLFVVAQWCFDLVKGAA